MFHIALSTKVAPIALWYRPTAVEGRAEEFLVSCGMLCHPSQFVVSAIRHGCAARSPIFECERKMSNNQFLDSVVGAVWVLV